MNQAFFPALSIFRVQPRHEIWEEYNFPRNSKKMKIRKKYLADIQFAQKTKTKIMKYREDNDSVLLFYEKRI